MTEYRQHRDNTETDKREEVISGTGSSSTTTKPHGAGRVLHPIDLEAIRTGYVDVLGPLNAYKARDIEVAINCGLEASAILDAIEQTARAARPSHAYLVAILRRYATYGITTRQEAEEDREAFRAKQEAARRETWGAWYHDPQDDQPW